MTLTTTAQHKPAAAPLAFDTTDAGFVGDPYPRYTELRESPDLHRSRDGLWVLTRHADVLTALRDPRLSSNPRHVDPSRERRGAASLLGDLDIQLMLTADAPDHTRLRRLANKAFTPRAVEALRPRVTELVDAMLDEAAAHGEVDLMAAIAEPLPVMVICELLGVPAADWDQFKPWSTAIGRVLDAEADPETMNEAVPAVMGFVQYFAGLIEERRSDPRADLLSALIAAGDEGDKLSERELFAMIILLFIAGHETTTNLLGNGTLALLRHRGQLDALRADPSLAVAATEELLRYDAPVQITARTATEALEINGLSLDAGEGIICGLAAANRDPRHVDEPDELRLERGRPTHLAFGNGMHHCLGAPLARLEGQVVFDRLARRFPAMELADERPPYRDHFVLRGLVSLTVALGDDAGTQAPA
ncbi:MAG TPA: cytochrome P450 [Acidimicrobiales bacterium]|nr:cytochrome P450 [Acidimicrobiales bacterium]